MSDRKPSMLSLGSRSEVIAQSASRKAKDDPVDVFDLEIDDKSTESFRRMTSVLCLPPPANPKVSEHATSSRWDSSTLQSWQDRAQAPLKCILPPISFRGVLRTYESMHISSPHVADQPVYKSSPLAASARH